MQLHREPVIKEAEDLCPMDEDKQAIAFRDIGTPSPSHIFSKILNRLIIKTASKLPYPPYPLKDQKSWLQKSIEEEVLPLPPPPCLPVLFLISCFFG